MIADSFLYSTTPASWVLGKLRWGLRACKTKWAFYQEIFFHEVETTLHLPTMGTWVVFPPPTPGSRHYLCLQGLLLGLTRRHGLTCRLRGYQSITCLRKMGLYHCRVIWCFSFTVACMPPRGTPSHRACLHPCPLEAGQLMETAVKLRLLLVAYPLLSLKPWLFRATSIPLQLRLLPLTTEL